MRYRFQSQCDHMLDLGIANDARSARAWFIEQSVPAFFDKPTAPFSNALFSEVHLLSHHRVCLANRTCQEDTRSLSQHVSSWAGAPTAPRLHVPRCSVSTQGSDVQYASQFSSP